MGRPKLRALVFWAFATLRVCCVNAQGLDYWVAFEREVEPACLVVTLRYVGGATGSDRLTLPAWFNGDTRSLHDFRLRVRGSAWRYAPDSATIDVIYPPGDTVLLSYRVAAYRPFTTTGLTLTPSFFVAPGFAFLVAPQWERFQPRIRFAQADCRALLPDEVNYPDLRWLETLCVGGAYRRLQGELAEVWITGESWPFADGDLLQMLENVEQAQRQLWRVASDAPLSLALTPTPPPPVAAQGGSAAHSGPSGIQLGSGLSCFAYPQSLNGVADLEHLLHHEAAHRRIGGDIREGAEFGNRRWAWMTEGFTEYMALQSRLRAGRLSVGQYVALLNEAYLRPYYASALSHIDNAQICARYSDPAYAEIAYLRGCILAFYLDMRMQKRDGTRLSDVLADLARAFGEQGRSMERDFDFFSKKISAPLGSDFMPIYQKHILRGEPIRNFILPPNLSVRFDAGAVPVLSVQGE